MVNLKLYEAFFAAVFILLIYLLWIMAKPILGPIIFASIIAGSFYPLFERIHKNRKYKIKREYAAVIVCLLVVILILIPTFYVVFQLSKETITLYQNLKDGLNDQSVNEFLFGDGFVATGIKKFSAFINIEIDIDLLKAKLFEAVRSVSGYAFKLINAWVGNVITLLFDLAVMLLVLYALFAEGDKLRKYLLKLSPLPDDQEELIITKFNQMNYVTLVCNGIGGLIQGGFAGIAFWAVGINSFILWSTIMVLLAFIPLLGISVIYIPTCIYLWIKGRILASILLFIFCAVLAFWTENWFKPKFIGNRIKINSLFVLLTIVGGMAVFGMAGIFYGPMIAIVFLTMVEIYHKSYA